MYKFHVGLCWSLPQGWWSSLPPHIIVFRSSWLAAQAWALHPRYKGRRLHALHNHTFWELMRVPKDQLRGPGRHASVGICVCGFLSTVQNGQSGRFSLAWTIWCSVCFKYFLRLSAFFKYKSCNVINSATTACLQLTLLYKSWCIKKKSLLFLIASSLTAYLTIALTKIESIDFPAVTVKKLSISSTGAFKLNLPAAAGMWGHHVLA